MMQPYTSVQRKLPVFVFPQSLTFYLDDQSTHKQILTLYNPYDFPLKFRVLCTAPHKYVVVDPEGIIKSRHCVDIVVRHIALSPSNFTTDKFRIQMQEHPSRQIIGKKDIEVKLVSGVPEPLERVTPDPDLFQILPNTGRNQQSYPVITSTNDNIAKNKDTNYVAIVISIFCLIGLLLPTVDEPNQQIPSYLHVAHTGKIAFGFLLGMAAVVLLRL